jgi:integrase/recombinase XerD
LLEVLLDDKAKRRLSNRSKTNSGLFTAYYNLLKVKLTPDVFKQDKRLLDLFHTFLGEYPPSEELALEFLAQYAIRSRETVVKYTGTIRRFMEWYGEDFNHRPRRPKRLPQWVNPDDIEKLKDCIRNKKTGKKTIRRDLMLIDFDCKTGLRRAELARLLVDDIKLKEKFVIVRKGKGEKDRSIPLDDVIVIQLKEFLEGMTPSARVFGLDARSITDLISTWAKKANVKITPHSFRHFFAEQLLDKGVDINIVSKLLGHESLDTTAIYLGLRPGSEREAIKRLGITEIEDQNQTDETGLPESRDKDEQPPGVNELFEAGKDHRRIIQRISHTLADSLNLPSVLDGDLWRRLPLEFKPGTYYFPIGQVDVDETGELTVYHSEVGTGVGKPHLMKAFFDHLSTSGDPRFAELTGDSGKLKIFQAKRGQYSKLLIILYKSMLDCFAGKGTPVHEAQEYQTGLTKNFFVSAWIEIIQRATGDKFIYDGWYKPGVIAEAGLLKLQCGGFDLGYAENDETLLVYERQHKDLVKQYLKSTYFEEISRRFRELEILVAEIKQELAVFGDKVKPPGICELCSEPRTQDIS